MLEKTLQFIFLISTVSFTYSFPLSTRQRWIIDAETGQRVKLACVNWPAHLQPMLAEGLDKRPLSEIVAAVSQMHFNCVRLTWSTFMFTRPSYGQICVSKTLDSLDLKEAKQGIAMNNPSILNMTHIEAYGAVVAELGAQGLMVLLDNHISKPDWCCSNTDGNAFFGDQYFDPNEWINGLSSVAFRFKGNRQVVAMSLRNELRGPSQNEPDWYKYISKGARVVHKTNPNVLVFVSGLNFDTNLSFLQKKPFALDLDNKLVYEIHWYSFSEDQNMWKTQPTNRICNQVTQSFINRADFLTTGESPAPLVLSEFGYDQGQGDVNLADHLYLTCLIAYAAERDLDWALWALQGSYYLREGQKGTEETFGALDATWQHPRNPDFIERLGFLGKKAQDPSSKHSSSSYIMFHPLSGNSVNANAKSELYASNRSPFSRWNYEGDGAPISLVDGALCLTAVGDGLPPMLSNDCKSQQSAWSMVSSTKLHLAAKSEHGELLCLQLSKTNFSQIVTSNCICIGDAPNCLENPESQWFKLVLTNVLSLA